MTIQSLHGRSAALQRHRPADDPAVVAVERELKASVAEAYITKLLATHPPLSAEDKLHLTRLLTDPAPLLRGDAA